MGLLPDGFADLEPFVSLWAVDGANNRACARDLSTEAERNAFYAVASAALAPALARLDEKSIAEFGEAEQRLMNLMLSLAHVALAVESQGDAEPAHAKARKHLPITRAPADAPIRRR